MITDLKTDPLACKINQSEKLFSHRISTPDVFTDNDKQSATYLTWVSLIRYGTIDSRSVQDLNLQHPFRENFGYFGTSYLFADGVINANGILYSWYSITDQMLPTNVKNSCNPCNSLFVDKDVKHICFAYRFAMPCALWRGR